MTIEQCNAMFQKFGYICLTIFSLFTINFLILHFKETIQQKLYYFKNKSSFLFKMIKNSLELEVPAYAFATFLICFLSYNHFPETKIKDGKTYFNNKVVIDCKTKQPILEKNESKEKVAFFSLIKSCKTS